MHEIDKRPQKKGKRGGEGEKEKKKKTRHPPKQHTGEHTNGGREDKQTQAEHLPKQRAEFSLLDILEENTEESLFPYHEGLLERLGVEPLIKA